MEANIAALSKFQTSNFFKKSAPTTKQECDEMAEQLTGMSVYATPVQGGDSYTVVASDETYVVQFRANDSPLDMRFLECVEQAYDGFIPRHQFVGNVGQLHVYTMGNVGGISMYLARDKLFENNFQLLRRTVADFARYVTTNIPYIPTSDAKETTQLILPTQVFRFGMTQDPEPDGVSKPRLAA